MRICNFNYSILKSGYNNRFLFILPFINICMYSGYSTVSIGWLVFHIYFYIYYIPAQEGGQDEKA